MSRVSWNFSEKHVRGTNYDDIIDIVTIRATERAHVSRARPVRAYVSPVVGADAWGAFASLYLDDHVDIRVE